MVVRTERGWAGHFVGSSRCGFRRNTLLECGDTRVVVSTVGMYQPREGEFESIGSENRCFETMAFHAERLGNRYWDADVMRQIGFSSPWSIHEMDADDRANDMHEAVVAELTARLESGEVPA